MPRILLSLVLITFSMLGLSAQSQAAPNKEIAPKAKMELLMVEEKGCMWCLQWTKDIGGIYPKTEEGRRAPLRRIDRDEPLPSDIQPARGFFYTPTFVLLVDGVEKGRIEGYPGEDFFWGLLDQLIASVDKTASSQSKVE